jgi:GNAT superfamily N-acetyltransferase
MTSVVVRDAALGDAAQIADLITQLGYPTTPDEMAQRLTGLLADLGYATFVSEHDSSIVGVAGGTLARYYEKNGLYARLVVLSVSSQSQGLGLGAALVGAVEDWAIARGAREIFVNSGNQRVDAHQFYASRGYRQTGVRLVKELEVKGGTI